MKTNGKKNIKNIKPDTETLDHNLILYFYLNPQAKINHKRSRSCLFETNEYLKTMKMFYKKYLNTEIKLKSKEIKKKFYYGYADLTSQACNLNKEESIYPNNLKYTTCFTAHTKPVTNIVFSNVILGLFYSCSWDGKVFVHNINPCLTAVNSYVNKNNSSFDVSKTSYVNRHINKRAIKENLENKTLKLFKGHTKGIQKIHEIPDSNLSLFSVSYDNSIKQWDVNYSKIINRNAFSYDLVDSIEFNKALFLLTQKNKKSFFSIFDIRLKEINKITLEDKYFKVLSLKSTSFLFINKHKQVHLFDQRNHKMLDLNLKTKNIFQGDEVIYFTQPYKIEIIRTEDLCRGNTVEINEILSSNFIQNSAEIIKKHNNTMISKDKTGFTIYRENKPLRFYANSSFISDFDFQENKLIFGEMDGSIFCVS
ncbi:Ribosome biogenesis protein YTM1 [Cucumispora dikerogammari]|nr:Ribosome biogenesis protein YTM1 [Cucumispora dikerogammari]